MKTIKENFVQVLKNSGFKNILILSSGVILAQIISFVLQPIVTRLYSPEDFGRLSLILSIVTTSVPLLTLQYELSIITAKTEREANSIVALNIYVLLVMTILIFGSVITFSFFNSTLVDDLGIWILVILPLLIVSGLERIVDAYNNRNQQYKLMSKIALIRSSASNLLKIILGLFKVGFFGLVVSQLVAVFLGIRKQASYLIENKQDILSIKKNEIIEVAKKYKVQPLYSMPGFFVTSASFSILPILISILYGVEETGFFYLTMTVLGIPLTLISTNVSKVFFKKATLEQRNKGTFTKTLLSTTILLIVVSGIGFTILWFVAEPVFSVVFGEEWIRSGTFVKVLVPLFAIRLIVSGVMTGFIISKKQFLKLIIQLMFILSCIGVFAITFKYGFTIELFLKLITYTYSIVFLLLLVILYKISKIEEYNK